MKMTLLELIKYKREQKELAKEIECPIANPLGLKFGSLISIPSVHIPDYIGDSVEVDCNLKAIENYVRVIDDEYFIFTDYLLKYNDKQEHDLKLRVCDEDVLLLTPYESMPYSDEMNVVLLGTERTGKIQVTENDEQIEYFRINDIKSHWNVEVKRLVDDGSHKITKASKITSHYLKYWDFGREVTTDGGIVGEFIIVEMDGTTGWITMRKGSFIDQQFVNII